MKGKIFKIRKKVFISYSYKKKFEKKKYLNCEFLHSDKFIYRLF
jgi:hypothetical protein